MSGANPSQNRLSRSTSPYLLQHASNPVDWYEWSEDAFKRAAAENKPIFLSVGYSACHWCHVLAHESFEDEAIAKVMNDNFVNIKVDREERPDVDRLYMTFLQAVSGGGGWPMSVWLTPELAPFFAGTYYPSPTFKALCERISVVWVAGPEKVRENAVVIINQLQNLSKTDPSISPSQVEINTAAEKVFNKLREEFDTKHGGFGGAPKFPSSPTTLNPLLRHAYYTDNVSDKKAAIDMVARTLLAIHRGGINDHVGKGIARYSVDAEWRLPHFEKMLYDQAQLTTSALECSLLVEDPKVRRELQEMAADITEYSERVLQSPDGAFFSAEDADSLPNIEATERQEGAYYVWSKSEIDNILGEHAPLFAEHFGVEDAGNIDSSHDAHGDLSNKNQLYTHLQIPQLAHDHGISADEAKEIINNSLAKLKRHRDTHRPRPHLDDKIVTAWNGYMLSALALAASVLPPDVVFPNNVGVAARSLKMAESIAKFVKDRIWNPSSGDLYRSWRKGRGPLGMCEDYAAMVAGLLDLYEATGDESHIGFAKMLQVRQDELFWDEEGGGYFCSRSDDQRLLVRLKDSQDGAEPSSLSLSVSNLYRLSHLITAEESSLRTKAEKTVASHSPTLKRVPHALCMMIAASQMGLRGMKQFIVVGTRGDAGTDNMLRSIRSRFVPNRSLIFIDPSAPPTDLAKHNEVVRSLVDDFARKDVASLVLPEVRICEGHVCGLPLRGDELKKMHL